MRLDRVGINAVFLQPRMGGLDTYAQALIAELVQLAPRTLFSVFLSAKGLAYLQNSDWAREVELVTHPALGRPGVKALSELTLLGQLGRRAGVDLLHSLAMTAPLWPGVPSVITIADLIWMQERTGSRGTETLWKLVVPPLARRADRILAISEAGRADIVSMLRVDASRVDVAVPGFGNTAAPEPEPEAVLRERHRLGDGPVVLSVSAKKPYKNLARLVAAWVEVVERFPDARLVLPGAPTSHEAELREQADALGIASTVRFLGFVGDHELEGLFALATGFAFPSLREGFGLPVLEAMARGVPVTCSDAAALREAAGDAALYFEAHRQDQLADRLLTLLGDESERRRLIAAGRARVASFSWRRTAEQTLECYERAAATNSS